MFTFIKKTLAQFHLLNRSARLFLLTIFFDGLLFSGFSLFLNLYILDTGHSRAFLGILNAAPSLAALFFTVPVGMLSDRIGRKLSMMLGFALANFGIIAMLLVRAEPLIILFSLLWGIAGQLYFISHAPFMMKVSDDKSRDILFSFSFGMFPLASTLGSFLSGYLPGFFRSMPNLPASVNPYQAAILVGVILSFVALIPLAFIHEPRSPRLEPQDAEKPVKPSIWKTLLKPLTIKLSLPNLSIGLGAAILVPYFNVFFQEKHTFSDSMLGTLFSVGALITGIGCLIGPRLVGNLGGKIRAVVLGQLASLGFLLLIGFSPWAWLAVIGYLARGALMNMVSPLFDSFALEQSHETEHGAVNSVRNLAWNVGWAIGPYISGLVQGRWGFTPLFISTAVLYAIGISLTWLFFRPRAASNLAPA